MSISADGYVTAPEGWPALTAAPAFVSGQSHGITEFLGDSEAALIGRTTFEPALNNDRWPWPTLEVFVLASERPLGTPDHVVTDSDPNGLLEKIRSANKGGDVHLIGGPRTIETFCALEALDKLELEVLPLLFGAGMRLTDSLSPDTGLALDSERARPGGSVEIVYSCKGQRNALSTRPASQRSDAELDGWRLDPWAIRLLVWLEILASTKAGLAPSRSRAVGRSVATCSSST
jgi:dihydrofolate reductase